MPSTTHVLGQTVEGAGELERLGEAERMRGRGAEELGGERRAVRLEAVHGAGRSARRDCVDEHDRRRLERLDEPDRLARQLGAAEPPRDLEARPRRR